MILLTELDEMMDMVVVVVVVVMVVVCVDELLALIESLIRLASLESVMISDVVLPFWETDSSEVTLKFALRFNCIKYSTGLSPIVTLMPNCC